MCSLRWFILAMNSFQEGFPTILRIFLFLCTLKVLLSLVLQSLSGWDPLRFLLKDPFEKANARAKLFITRVHKENCFCNSLLSKKKLRYEICFHHFNRGTWGHVNEVRSSAAVDKNVFCFHSRDWFMKNYRWGFVWSFNMNLETACGKIMGVLQKTLPSHLSCLGILWDQEEVTPTGDFTSSTVLQKIWYCTLPGRLGGCLVRMENTNRWANVSCLPLLLHKACFLDSVSQVGFFTYALMQNKVWRRDDRIYTAL